MGNTVSLVLCLFEFFLIWISVLSEKLNVVCRVGGYYEVAPEVENYSQSYI